MWLCTMPKSCMQLCAALHNLSIAVCKAAASTLLHSSALSNLSHCRLVQPLLSASHHHCSVLSHCTTAVHAVLIVLPVLIPFSLGLTHQFLSPHCSLQSCIVSSLLPLTEDHWPQSHCLLTNPHLAFRFLYHWLTHIPPQWSPIPLFNILSFTLLLLSLTFWFISYVTFYSCYVSVCTLIV
jgi:hypothetical protein